MHGSHVTYTSHLHPNDCTYARLPPCIIYSSCRDIVSNGIRAARRLASRNLRLYANKSVYLAKIQDVKHGSENTTAQNGFGRGASGKRDGPAPPRAFQVSGESLLAEGRRTAADSRVG